MERGPSIASGDLAGEHLFRTRQPTCGWGASHPWTRYTIGGMVWGEIATTAFYVDLLAEQGPLLGEPYTKQLSGELRELRFHLDGRSWRISYWIASGGGSSC